MWASALEQMPLWLDDPPLIRIGWRRLALVDGLPQLGELRVDRLVVLLVVRQVVFGKDRLNRTLRDTEVAIDAFVGVDHQEVRSFAKAVDGADIDAICIFASNATLGYHIGHCYAVAVKVCSAPTDLSAKAPYVPAKPCS